MIVEKNQENEAIYLGQVQENKVDIDRENIDFIASLLTTNLYSAPLESFLRETISNGEDAQKEAGVEDPLLMIITPDGDSHFKITIRDFGTGISEEKFDRIYRKIGTSTKRESNEYIGHFGIGKFASLAVSDVVNIVSYYNNKRYDYLMYKNGDSINIDRISIKDGEYSNGLEVTVRLPNSERYTLLKIVYKFCFFEKLFLVDNSNIIFNQNSIDAFNKRKVYYNDDMAACDYISGDNIRAVLYGKVLYPINPSFDWHRHIQGNIIYRFNIGELDVTPNRESLRYSNKTNNAINSKLQKVTSIFEDIISKQCSKGFDNIAEWYKWVENSYITVTALNQEYKIKQSQITSVINTSIRGVNMPNDMYKLLKMIKGNLNDDVIKYQISDGIFFSGKHHYIGTDNLFGIYPYDRFIVTNNIQYSPITKKYVLTKINKPTASYYNSIYVLNKKELMGFKHYLAIRMFNALRDSNVYSISINKNDPNIKAALKIIFEDVNKQFDSFICIDNKDVPKEFKDSLKAAKTTSTTPKDKKEIRSCVVEKLKAKEVYCYSDYACDKISVDTSYELQDLLKKYKNHLIVYGSKKDTTIKTLAYIYFRKGDYDKIFVQLAESKMHLLKGYRNTIEVNDFITSKVKDLYYLATVDVLTEQEKEKPYIFSITPSSQIFSCVHSKYTKKLKDLTTIVYKYQYKYKEYNRFKDIKDIINMYIQKGWYEDFSVVVNDPFMNKLMRIQYKSLKDGGNEETSYLFIFYLSKCKQVLPNPIEYVKFKNNALTNIN